jgi:hypothetical protein
MALLSITPSHIFLDLPYEDTTEKEDIIFKNPGTSPIWLDFEPFECAQTDILSRASRHTVLIDPGDFLTFEMRASHWGATSNGSTSLLLKDASTFTGSVTVNLYDRFPRGIHYMRRNHLILSPISRQTLQFTVTISPGVLITPLALRMRMRNKVRMFDSDCTDDSYYNTNDSSSSSSISSGIAIDASDDGDDD